MSEESSTVQLARVLPLPEGRPASVWFLSQREPAIEHGEKRTLERGGSVMKTLKTITVLALSLTLLWTLRASAADDSKLKDATRQVESGAKTAGEGIADTAKGLATPWKKAPRRLERG